MNPRDKNLEIPGAFSVDRVKFALGTWKFSSIYAVFSGLCQINSGALLTN